MNSYYRKDGTYVQPHYRSNPDGNPYNNWSYPGNTNPYTGKTASGDPITYLRNYYGTNYSTYIKGTFRFGASGEPNRRNPFGRGNGSVSVYTNRSTDNINIFVDEKYVGTLKHYLAQGQPICGQEGTVFVTMPSGTYKVEGRGVNGEYWVSTVVVVEGQCFLQLFY